MKATILAALLLLPRAVSAQQTVLERTTPAEAGFSEAGLAELERFLEVAGSSGMIILHEGRIVFEWGDTRREHAIHSIRKALLNSLIGIHVARGVVDTSATIAQLDIDDIGGLTPAERRARVADLLRSRSGVYHDAAAEAETMIAGRPARGAHAPGEQFYYNNWDFNVLGAITERASGRSVFELFRDEIARPLGMSGYHGVYDSIDASVPVLGFPAMDGFYQYERDRSRYPAYHFRMSARDLALYGELYRLGGAWRGEQIVPADWIAASTRPHSITDAEYGLAYGMLWGVVVPDSTDDTPSFFHTGAGVHMLGVYPESGIVFVHRVDTEAGADFDEASLYRIISLVFAAHDP